MAKNLLSEKPIHDCIYEYLNSIDWIGKQIRVAKAKNGYNKQKTSNRYTLQHYIPLFLRSRLRYIWFVIDSDSINQFFVGYDTGHTRTKVYLI